MQSTMAEKVMTTKEAVTRDPEAIYMYVIAVTYS